VVTKNSVADLVSDILILPMLSGTLTAVFKN
jgi:hypothetical protein